MINRIKHLLLFILFYTMQCGSLLAQDYKPCKIEVEYYVKPQSNYTVDSSRINVIIEIPCKGKPIDYKIVFSELWEVDFSEFYCKEKQYCEIEEVVTKLNKQRKCAIIIEFSNGDFEFLSSLSGALTNFSNINLIGQYAIFHQDKGATFFRKEIYPRCSVQAFIWGEKFRVHILLLELDNRKQKPVNFITDWMESKELLKPLEKVWQRKND